MADAEAEEEGITTTEKRGREVSERFPVEISSQFSLAPAFSPRSDGCSAVYAFRTRISLT